MPKKHKRLSGLTTSQIARKFRLTGGRVTQILHGVGRKLAPRKLRDDFLNKENQEADKDQEEGYRSKEDAIFGK
jgi:hypothetical protein